MLEKISKKRKRELLKKAEQEIPANVFNGITFQLISSEPSFGTNVGDAIAKVLNI